MTTVAWDGKTLASDTKSLSGAGLIGRAKKIYRLDKGAYPGALLGISGQYSEGLELLSWLLGDGERPRTWEDGNGMLIMPDGQIFMFEKNLVRVPVRPRCFHATGSGRDFALAAMLLGKNAVEAVEVSAQFDEGTGGEIETLQLDKDSMYTERQKQADPA